MIKEKSEKSKSKSGPQAFLDRMTLEGKGKPGRTKGKDLQDLEVPPRVEVRRSGKLLRKNYEAILDLVGGPRNGLFLLPMVKADAYGHGLEWAVEQLKDSPHLLGFGVATASEGKSVRKILGLKKSDLRVLVFSQTGPWTENKAQFFEAYGLTAVIANETDLRAFLKREDYKRVPFELFFNTGMNRLGLPVSLLREIGKQMQGLEPEYRPTGVGTHLGMGEDPNSSMSRLQATRWREVYSALKPQIPGALFHFGNSAAIWNAKAWNLQELSDFARPGLSLYGAPPTETMPQRGTASVMSVRAPVIQVHRLAPGESMGYGAGYTAPPDQAVHVAVLDVGYADGLHRSLGGTGSVSFERTGARSPIVGRVSMDLAAVLCRPDTRPGEWVEVWGDSVGLWSQALAAKTIPYELMTAWAKRVPRLEQTQ